MSTISESEFHTFRKFRGDPDIGICAVFNIVGNKRLNAHGKLKDHFKISVLELPDRLINIQKAGIDPNITRQVIKDFLALEEPPSVSSPNPDKLEKKQINQAGLAETQRLLRGIIEKLSIAIDS